MTRKSLTTALTLYRARALSLEQAAAYSDVSPQKLATELRSRSIPIREHDDALSRPRVAD